MTPMTLWTTPIGPFDLMVAGQGRNGFDGLKLLRRRARYPPGTKGDRHRRARPDAGLGAIRHRAYSYFHKPLTPGPLAEMVQQALDAKSGRTISAWFPRGPNG